MVQRDKVSRELGRDLEWMGRKSRRIRRDRTHIKPAFHVNVWALGQVGELQSCESGGCL